MVENTSGQLRRSAATPPRQRKPLEEMGATAMTVMNTLYDWSNVNRIKCSQIQGPTPVLSGDDPLAVITTSCAFVAKLRSLKESRPPGTTPPLLFLRGQSARSLLDKCPYRRKTARFITHRAQQFCLLDWTDFPNGSHYRSSHSTTSTLATLSSLKRKKAANSDTKLTAGDPYYVVAVTDTTIGVSATKGGDAITLTQTCTGGADTTWRPHRDQVRPLWGCVPNQVLDHRNRERSHST